MSVIVKICGLSTEETVDAALAAGADMIGFVFFPKSPRFVTTERAATLAERARGRAGIVALTVDMDDAGLAEIAQTVKPDWLQLHGNESVDRVAAVRHAFGLPVMKALGIGGTEDLARVPAYAEVADRLLLDAKPPKGAKHPGGNGVAFDWHLLDALDPGLSYMLSGGLDADNVAEALALTRPFGIDASSGVESAPGIKDPDRIHAFIAAIRGFRPNADQGPAIAGERMTS
ncbi:N-(5'-phosphoribosyl)anthranilate isomerase [Kaistia sp. 32K]|uniref:phosphoribosylanthranilate isomerase n=1 Tax=Kaistia sp. 32K TaxID=2795690 RepID=UPI0019161522|nr:phosphoribosylanthranilate isomerase [Kaistia sp. 32K]BCP55905.1 N-(5'-phosphoribosyl)anthranilate isomerase [Kaistia sp. 32K]